MSKWNVTFRRPDDDGGFEYESGTVEAPTESEAEGEASVEKYGEWEVYELTRLCDFCEPAPHENCEAYTQISVADPGDVMNEPLGSDAPERSAWVCIEHHNVVTKLPTFRAERAENA